ncbi:MAG TPA: MATE family efflux transporter [Vicinamibacterales bacterium]|nr:MATE family efflux transporter [Vicinamibacterales bacterium]
MVALAGPVALAEVGWVSMGIVDTIFVGPLGPAAIGAVGVGSILFQAVAIFGMGLLLGLDTLVSQACGARRLDECHRWLVQGLVLSLFVAPLLTGLALVGIALLPAWGLTGDVLRLLVPYLRVVVWSLLPLLFYAAFRRYLQALAIVKPVTVALISANVINAIGDWALVYGHLGLPALGTTGSGVATLVSRVYLAAFLAGAVLYYDRRHHVSLFGVSWLPSRKRMMRLVRLGLPAATQVTLELGVFAAASALAGRLDAVSLAAHQVALNLASLSFMVPLGIASAGAVRVGHAVGRLDAAGARAAGWMAVALGVGFMATASAAFILVPGPLFRAFTSDTAVIALGARLLLVAGMFQMFDGLQGVATGVLRGLGDTRTPMVSNLVGHWLVGLPLGYLLTFVWGWGVIGLWLGLSTGLISIAMVLLLTWQRRIRSLEHALAA